MLFWKGNTFYTHLLILADLNSITVHSWPTDSRRPLHDCKCSIAICCHVPPMGSDGKFQDTVSSRNKCLDSKQSRNNIFTVSVLVLVLRLLSCLASQGHEICITRHFLWMMGARYHYAYQLFDYVLIWRILLFSCRHVGHNRPLVRRPRFCPKRTRA